MPKDTYFDLGVEVVNDVTQLGIIRPEFPE